MKTLCTNGNSVERFYDRRTRSSVTRVLDPQGNQIGEADYSGNKKSADYARDIMVKDNGGKVLPRARCGKCGSTNLKDTRSFLVETYACQKCGEIFCDDNGGIGL